MKTSQFVLTGLKCIILRQIIERIQLLFCLVLNYRYYRFTLVYIRWITYNISIYEVCTLLCIEMVIYKLFSGWIVGYKFIVIVVILYSCDSFGFSESWTIYSIQIITCWLAELFLSKMCYNFAMLLLIFIFWYIVLRFLTADILTWL